MLNNQMIFFSHSGVNTYSQLMSAFRAQGDLTDEKLNLLPVLQNVFGVSRERHTAEIKRALNDEQLSDIVSTCVSPSSVSISQLFYVISFIQFEFIVVWNELGTTS